MPTQLENLVIAARAGDLKVVEELLKIPDVRDKAASKNNFALFCAVVSGHKNIVETLLKIPDVRDKAAANDNRLLSSAAADGRKDIVEALLKIDDVRDKAAAKDNEALRLAAQNGRLNIVEILLKIDDVRDKAAAKDNYALHFSAQNGHLKIVEILLKIPEVKAKAAADGYKTLGLAAQNGHKDIVEALLKIDDVRDKAAAKDNEALRLAAQNGRLNIVEILLKIDDVRDKAAAKDNYALHFSAQNGHLKIVEILLKIPEVKAKAAADGYKTLGLAAQNGHKDIVEALLKIDDVRDKAAAKDNEALRLAAQNGRLEIVNRLLDIPEVKAKAAAKDNKALGLAAQNGHKDIVEALLKIPEVKKEAAADDNYALFWAAANNHKDIVEALLKIPDVRDKAAVKDNYLLRWAARNGHKDIVNTLLSIPGVKDKAAAKDNEALRLAGQNGHLEIVNTLLTIKPVQQRLLLTSGELRAFFWKNFPVFRQSAIEKLSIYGMPLSKLMDGISQNDQLDVLKLYLEHPIAYLESRDFPSSTIEAVRIIYTAGRVENHKRDIAERERNRERFDNVDDEARIGAVRSHYSTTIKPHFQHAFEKYSQTDKERIEKIEYAMRELFLEAIKEEAREKPNDENAKNIINFINSLSETKRKDLLEGNNPALMTEARRLFSDTTSDAQTAWRAYDKWALVEGEWPNLLTPPLNGQEKGVYTVTTVGLTEPTTQMASDLSREMFAYSYLLATDKEDGDDSTRITRKTVLISKIAETRRAHNSTSGSTDDPSCLPGTVSRAGDTWVAHAKSVIPNRLQLLKEELASFIIGKFQQITPKAEQEKLYEALYKLSAYTAVDILSGKQMFSKEDIVLRQRFIDGLGKHEEIHERILQQFQARGSLETISKEEFDIYALALLADIGGPWLIEKLTAIYRSGLELDNPFASDADPNQKKPINAIQAQNLLTEKLNGIEFEGKRLFIFNLARLCTSEAGYVEAKAKLQEKIPPEKKKQIIEEIEVALKKLQEIDPREAEIGRKKSELWLKLNQSLKEVSIENKGDILRDIVNKVIDESAVLREVLQKHNLPIPESLVSGHRPLPILHTFHDQNAAAHAQNVAAHAPSVAANLATETSTTEESTSEKTLTNK